MVQSTAHFDTADDLSSALKAETLIDESLYIVLQVTQVSMTFLVAVAFLCYYGQPLIEASRLTIDGIACYDRHSIM